ncbi:MAG: inositol monophosphatase family protein [Rhodospirillaceae bacterium]
MAAFRSANINVMVAAAQKAGRSLTRDFGEVENLQVSRKGPGDFVSNADLRAEKIVQQELRKARPKFGFLMEEGGTVVGEDPTRRWIIDPLDGTTNFLHGLPHFAVSIALEERGEIIAGVVYNPISDELFTAEKGSGAFLNERRIRVSGRTALEDSLFATGIPFRGRGDHPGFVKQLAKVMAVSSGVRRYGAAALDLAYVAAGKYEGFWEERLSPWDIAAGVLMVREAGGFVTDFAGKTEVMSEGSVVAANYAMHKPLLSLLKPS